MTISNRTRRILGVALCNRDEADAFCDGLDDRGGAVNTGDQLLTVKLPALAAGEDLANFPLASFDVAVVITKITILADGAFAGVDASNTMVVAVKDQANNTIVSKTYDNSTVPADNDGNDLGTLNSTHKKLTANELCKISVTNGATADPPPLTAILTFHVGTS